MKIIYSKRLFNQLEKTPTKIVSAFQERLNVLIKDPFHPLLNNHALRGEWVGFRSINITGDWRAIFQILDDRTIFFIIIGTHSQLYRQ